MADRDAGTDQVVTPNIGELEHELSLYKTDLDPGSLTVGPRSGKADTAPLRESAGAVLRHAALPGLSCALVGLVLVIDAVLIGRSLTEKGPPDSSLVYLIRIGAIALAAAMLVIWLETRAGRRSGSELSRSPGRTLVFALLPLVAAVAFVALLFRDPFLFFRQAREDAVIESAQVGMLLLAAGLFAHRYLRGLFVSGAGRTHLSLTAPVALGLLLVALEEVSWGQRMFGFETAGVFRWNGQGETNLHNFGTNAFEAVYYFGLFLGLVFGAYLGDRTALRSRFRGLAEIAPSAAVLLAAAPAVAFNYGEWNQLTTQLAVFTTLAILVAYLIRAARDRPAPLPVIVAATALVGFVAVQVALLAEGDAMLRWWQNTEYKELLGTLALLLWAIEVARRPGTRRAAAGS